LLRLHATIHTQTVQRRTNAASTTRGNSRQTDGKGPFCIALALLPRAFPFVCHRQATVQMFREGRCLVSPPSVTEAPQSDMVSVRLVGLAIGRIVGSGFIELAVERGTADFQPARNFGHLPAVMRDREADDLSLHLLERPHFP
jgi:hypothetical protein